MRKRPSFLLISIIWLALALRLLGLGKQSLWYDEGVTWYLTQFSPLGLIRWTAADIQPPFYYLLLWLTTRLFGQSEWALRFPSVLFGVVSVPLIWRLGRQLFRQAGGLWRQRASYLAAFFLVASPLMVYYSQEARMYTLLVFQASLASYLILHFVAGPASRWLIFSYILVMTTALYTHYFALFLLLAHLIYVLLFLVRYRAGGKISDQRSVVDAPPQLGQSLVMFLGVGLLFAPWIPVLLARLGDDPSYWPGLLKLNEVVQDVFISFAVGGKREMIFEADGLPLAAGFGLLLLLSLSLLLWRRTQQARLAVLFLLLWLVLPISLILLLSYQTPKFNPRYTMLSWPAFALILAGGLSGVLDHRRQTVNGRRGESIDGRRSAVDRQILSYSILTIILLFVIFSWGFSLRNWFFVPEFSRDDFKHVAQFIRERSFLNEPVLLSSGHFFPVWLYYFGPDNWTPLPNMETLDVNRVTNFDIGPQLAASLQGQPGVWLVTWQDEVVDPNKVVPLLLDVVGQRTTDPLLIGQFWGVDLQYWHLRDPLNFPPDFPTTIPADVNFGNLVRLRGLWQDEEDNAEVVLFWEALQPLSEDYVISLRLIDEAGLPWSEGIQVARPAAYLYPTLRWPPHKIVSGRQTLPWLPGAPPGEYWLEVGWLTPDGQGIDVLDENGNPQRRTVQLGPIRLTEPIPGPDLASYPEGGRPFGALELLAEQFEPTEVEAGSKVVLETIWQMTDQSESERLTFAGWQDGEGNFWPLVEPVSLSLRAIPPGTIFRARDRLTTPYQAPPGEVILQAQVSSAEGGQAIRPVASLTLRSTERTFAPPADLDMEVGANFANLATLLGATLSQTDLSPEQSATLTLYWRAEGVFEADYTVFVHLLSPDGAPILNFDHPPPRPTTNWLEGEIVADPITLAIPADFPAGRYPLEVGLYNTADPNLARLARVDESTADYVILTEIEVVGP